MNPEAGIEHNKTYFDKQKRIKQKAHQQYSR